jgi:hypothetical protein
MPHRPRREHESALHLEPVAWLSAAERRSVLGSLKDLERERANERKARAHELDALRSSYRAELAAFVGADGWRRYAALRRRRAKTPRPRWIREATALADELGLHRARGRRIHRKYVEALHAQWGEGTFAAPSEILDPARSPWVTYAPPYAGSFWSYAWDRSGNVSDPVLARYLEEASGRTGSRIRTRLDGADDDDHLSAEYYTCHYAWHTALANGPLDAYVALTFRTSTFSGKVEDEWGLSTAVYNQWARVRFRVLGTTGLAESQESRIFNVTGAAWGDDESWSDSVAAPNDVRSFYFRTSAAFSQGEPLLLEAGVLNTTWFTCDDQSIETADDLDLRLARIEVRSR